MHTVESILTLLATNDKAVARALLALNARQTQDEQQIAYWRKTDRSGAMRIGIYARQLLEVAEERAKAA